jgi:hypothetical protein
MDDDFSGRAIIHDAFCEIAHQVEAVGSDGVKERRFENIADARIASHRLTDQASSSALEYLASGKPTDAFPCGQRRPDEFSVCIVGNPRNKKGTDHVFGMFSKRGLSPFIPKNKLSRQSANREREPWLLASNLPEDQWNPSRIVAIYKQRMQIEESFRDVKSEHFGVGVTRHRSHCPRRIEVLLLISALANYIICLTGLQAREANHERHFQNNSLKRRRVMSLWRLGLEYWRSRRGSNSRKTLVRLERALRAEVHQQAQVLE